LHHRPRSLANFAPSPRFCSFSARLSFPLLSFSSLLKPLAAGGITMAALSIRRGNARLPPEVNRVLYVRNLPFNISSEEMYDIFGKYGAIRQIRIGTNKDTRGTAFVVYEDIYDAKNAVDHLSGFNVANRYLIVLYYQQAKMSKKVDQRKKDEELTKLQEKYGVSVKD
jgi:pre-mRNA branch site protein p14